MRTGEAGATNTWREPKFGAKVELEDITCGASRRLYQRHGLRRNDQCKLEVIPKAKLEV